MTVMQVRLEDDTSNFVTWVGVSEPKSVKLGYHIEYEGAQYEVTSIYGISDANW